MHFNRDNTHNAKRNGETFSRAKQEKRNFVKGKLFVNRLIPEIHHRQILWICAAISESRSLQTTNSSRAFAESLDGIGKQFKIKKVQYCEACVAASVGGVMVWGSPKAFRKLLASEKVARSAFERSQAGVLTAKMAFA